MKTKGVTLEDNIAVIRRLDIDASGLLRADEFAEFCTAEEPYSKMLTRNQLKKEE